MVGHTKDRRRGRLAGRLVAAVIGLVAVAGPSTALAAQGTGGDIGTQASCGDTEDVYINGGEAHWTINCSGGETTISGWHKDTKADGRCVQVYGSVSGNSFITPRACPSGEREIWSRTVSGTSNIKVYARTL
ncbi:hypothetical protein [Salininema proteolyticum]|uniref:Uncharacterized protein n=1 Tax=Salininema proteolyticum TaxID=1607685 RepID=A0ABV8U5A4_9ACTN